MQIAVIILNWNGRALLEQFLPSVVTHSSQQAQIYVTDNASTDDSIVFLENHYPTVKIIKNQKNYGYAQGYNQALSGLQEDIFVLLNSDVEVTAGWLNPIHRLFADPKIAAVQPKILDYNNPHYFEYAGAAGGYIDSLGYPYCRGRIFNTIEPDQGQYEGEQPIFWASGACLFVRREHFWQVGGFDSDYFAHQEEIDLCWRFFNHQLEVWYTSQSVVYHVGGGTLQMESPRKTFLNFRNSLYNLLKNAPRKALFIRLFIRLCLDGVAAIRFLGMLKFRHFGAIIHSHLSFYQHFVSMYKKRRKGLPWKKFYQTFSVVYQYFILKKTKYSSNYIK